VFADWLSDRGELQLLLALGGRFYFVMPRQNNFTLMVARFARSACQLFSCMGLHAALSIGAARESEDVDILA
jgi:hypothetical protein